MSRAWYQLALAPPSSERGPSGRPVGLPITLVAAQGDHLGEAIAAAAKVHPQHAVVGARLCPTAPLGDSVGRSRHVVEQSLPAELAGLERASAFPWPAGVVPELTALGQLEGAAAGYIVEREPRGVAVEVQVAAIDLGETFLGWIERLPVADNLEVRLLHHFEERATTEVWLTPRIGVKQILRFLDAHDRELIDNGFVELAVYLRKEGSTLRLTEHKTLLWTSVDASTVERTQELLAALKVRPASALVSVASAPHFHVRAAGSRDRDGLGKYLHKQRLRVVDRLDRQGSSQPAAPPA